MSGLKLSGAAASIGPKTHIRLRAIATTKSSVSPYPTGRRRGITEELGLSLLTCDFNLRRMLRSCAPFAVSAHFSLSSPSIISEHFVSHNGLGFRFPGDRLHRVRSSSSSSFPPPSSSSASSSEKGWSSSSGSGIAEDMGQDNAWPANQNCLGHGRLHDGEDRLLRQSQSPATSPWHSQQHQQSSSKFLTLPTVLTLARVAAVPLLVATFHLDSWLGRTATTSIFIGAAFTDWLDGYIARKMRLGSAFGAFLDPVADKLMVAATLILLCTRPMEVAMFGHVPWLMTAPSIAIIGREITMSAVREWAASQTSKLLEAVAVNNLGKWKTATQMTALTVLLATRNNNAGGLVALGVLLLYVSAGLSVWSLVVYMSKIRKVLLK